MSAQCLIDKLIKLYNAGVRSGDCALVDTCEAALDGDTAALAKCVATWNACEEDSKEKRHD